MSTRPYLVISRRQSTSVGIFDIRDKVLSVLDVGAVTLGAKSDGSTAALVAPDAGEIIVVSGRPPSVARVTGLRKPHEVAFISEGRVAVTEENGSDVAIVDLVHLSVLKRIKMPARPHDVVLGASGRLLVTLPDARQIAWVDAASDEVTVVNLGERPHACVEVARRAWCVTYDRPHLLEVGDGGVLQKFSVGVFPHHLRALSDGRLIISDPTGGSIFVVDSTGKVVSTTRVARAEQFVEFDGDVYVASDDGFVALLRDGQEVSRTQVQHQPHAVAIVSPATPHR